MNQFSFSRRASYSAALAVAWSATLLVTAACSAPIGVKSDSSVAAGKAGGSAGRRAAAAEGGSKSSATAGKGSAGAKAGSDDGKAKPDGGTVQVGAGGSGDDDRDQAGDGSKPGSSGASGSASPASAGSYANGAAGQSGGTPAMLADVCMGKTSEYACDRSVLYHCTEMGAYDRETHCSTPGQCKAGLKTGECGLCDPGSARCNAQSPETPETCTEDGKWQQGTACASAALCNSMTGTCDMSGCSAGQVRCNGDALEICKDDLTGFDTMEDCGTGMCNAEKKHCNDCVPDTVKCADDMRSLDICSADGTESPQACTGDKQFCLNDKCAQCLMPTDCKPTSECRDPSCVNGTCAAGAAKPLKTPCQMPVTGAGAGVCNLIGNCVTCVDDNDCHDASKRCNPANVFTPCESRSPLEATLSLLGGYTVTVAPGYRVQIEKPASLSLSINLGTVPCPGTSCVLPATGQATTYTFSGPSCDGRSLLQTRTEMVSLQFGDGSVSDAGVGTVCSNTVTLTATSK